MRLISLERLLDRILRFRARAIAIGEQLVLSVANFVMVLAAGRLMHGDAFASLGVALSATVVLQGVHRTVITIPFVVETAPQGRLEHEGRAWLQLSLFTATAFGLVGALIGLICLVIHQPLWMSEALLASGPYTIVTCMFEFTRRWMFQERAYLRMLIMSTVISAIQIACLFVLASLNALTPTLSLVAMSIATAIGVVVVFIPRWARLDRVSGQFRAIAIRQVHFGKWSALGTLAYNGYNNMIPILLGFFSGAPVVAAFSASRQLMQPVLIPLMAVNNVDKQRSSQEFAAGGLPRLKASLFRTGLLLFSLCAIYAVAAVVLGPMTMDLMFRGKYHAGPLVFALWGLVFIFTAVVQPLETSMYVLRQAHATFYAKLMGGAVAIAAVALLSARFGAGGAVAAAAIGWAVTFVASWIAVTRRWARMEAEAPEDTPSAEAMAADQTAGTASAQV